MNILSDIDNTLHFRRVEKEKFNGNKKSKSDRKKILVWKKLSRFTIATSLLYLKFNRFIYNPYLIYSQEYFTCLFFIFLNL